MYAFDRHDVGLPGMPKNGMPSTARTRSACPASRRCRERSSAPRAATRSTIRSRSPTELPPENTMMSASAQASSALGSAVDRVAGRPCGSGSAAVRGDDGARA